jgi:ubiquinone/menaquinone biosynthesis C-methylase UbiE
MTPKKMKQQARREFEAWAHTYDASILQRLLFKPCYTAILQELHRDHQPAFGTRRMLDIGSGTGTLAAQVIGAELAGEVIGLDYAHAMCRQAQNKARRADIDRQVHFVNGDSEHLPFPDGYFNVVTCSNSFHHYPHQQESVLEMRRVLAPGGKLMLVDGFRDNMIGWFVFDVCVAKAEKEVFHAPWSTVRAYFERAGFTGIMQRKINVLAPVLLTVGVAQGPPARQG